MSIIEFIYFSFNEQLFLIHLIAISLAVLIALKLGKEALVTLMSVFVITMNIFITKQINLMSLILTTTDCFTIGIGLILNLIQEYWNKDEAIKSTKISFFMSAIFLVMACFQLSYIPDISDMGMHEHFVGILNFTPRIIIASLISFFVAQTIDANLYAYLKSRLGKKYFVLRNYGSLIVSQAIDTVLFSFIGLYGIVSDITDIIFASYIIKILAILLAIPFVAFARKFIKVNSR
jgi:uncharacterized integral membrane protein (TIGR00697 family)